MKASRRCRPALVRMVRARAIARHSFAGLPVAHMISRGWLLLENDVDVSKVRAELLRFFRRRTWPELVAFLANPPPISEW